MKLKKDRLPKIQEAKIVIEQRLSERYQKEKEEYDAKMKQRRQKKEETGKSPGAKNPKPHQMSHVSPHLKHTVYMYNALGEPLKSNIM